MYNLNYLQNTSVEKIQPFFPDKRRSQILTILSKSLGYRNFGHLKREYIIQKNGNILNLKNEEQEKTTTDLSFDGFIFNEYTLSTSFNIKLERAFHLKSLIDSCDQLYEYGKQNGNIRVSDILLLKLILSNFSKLSTKRIMATFPFEFYCRRESNYKLIINGKHKIKSFFWFDGFNVSYLKYFKGNLDLFMESLLKEFLIYDNVIFLKNIIESYQKKDSNIFKKCIQKFNPMFIKAPGEKFGEDVIFIPKTERK